MSKNIFQFILELSQEGRERKKLAGNDNLAAIEFNEDSFALARLHLKWQKKFFLHKFTLLLLRMS